VTNYYLYTAHTHILVHGIKGRLSLTCANTKSAAEYQSG